MKRLQRSRLTLFLSFLSALFATSTLSGTLYAQTTRGIYTTTANVPLRSGPGSNYDLITTLPMGSQINVVGKEGYWLKVESKHGGKPGYLDRRDVERWTER